jgi:phosphoribosylglycinamide formyltransferase 1
MLLLLLLLLISSISTPIQNPKSPGFGIPFNCGFRYHHLVTRSNPYRLGILGSGKGSNMAAIAEACASGKIPASIALVLSDVPEAGILEHAKRFAVPLAHIAPGKYRTKLDEEAERTCIQRLTAARVDLIVLAGFMRILKGDFLKAFADRVVNIHPSLLPAFPGLEAWKQALDHGVKVTGCTVHFVDQGVDSGPIIAQETVPVLEGDTPEILHARIQEAERNLYPATIGALAEGRVTVKGRQTLWRKA